MRKVDTRLLITGTLLAESPLHVGGHGEDPDTDLPLARNGRGEVYVPGTSFAGALRSWCERAFGDGPMRDLWGFQPTPKEQEEARKQADVNKKAEARKDGEPEKDEVPDGHASFVLIDDAAVAAEWADRVEIREGVGIDRVWGTAAEHIKYDRAVLPKGTALPFAMRVEIETSRAAPTKAAVGHLLAALEKGSVQLGAAQTRGLGHVKLTDIAIKEQTLSSRDGILATLAGGGDDRTVEALIAAKPDAVPKPPDRLHILLHWEPRGPLMVKSERDGFAVDSLPLVSGNGNGGSVAMVLPGSSVKGVLRSHAERIVRTLSGSNASRIDNPLQRFLAQLQDVPLVPDVFGAAKERSGNGKARNQGNEQRGDGTSQRGRGALGVADCYAKHDVTEEAWAKIEQAAPAEDGTQEDLLGSLAAAGLADFAQAWHVAVDRWTGGAAESLLYTVLEPFGVSWGPIVLTLDFDRLKEQDRLPALALLLLVLRDMVAGRLPVGFATNRGMGQIAMTKVVLTDQEVDVVAGETEDLRVEELEVGGVSLRGLSLTWSEEEGRPVVQIEPAAARERINAAWQSWIDGGGAEAAEAEDEEALETSP